MPKQALRMKDEHNLFAASQADLTEEHAAHKINVKVVSPPEKRGLYEIEALSTEIEAAYRAQLETDASLSRGLVSFQANKSRSVYRWYKFKEAFSASLVEVLLERYGIKKGILLDPFAGSGTSLFASSNYGLSAEGIELLPIGQRIIDTKKLIDSGLTKSELDTLRKWSLSAPWRRSTGRKEIPELRITKGAYSAETVTSFEKFLYAIDAEGPRVASVLFFALLCILEVISFTRKDGQYLRWDHRSGRRQGNRPFNKGKIPSFDEAMSEKLVDIVSDLAGEGLKADLFEKSSTHGNVILQAGSCLDILPTLPGSHYDCIITSPPYCNRYDYTRTYALELALLGVDELTLRRLRQEMLSCTVENRGKDLIGMNARWANAIAATDGQKLFQKIMHYLNDQKDDGSLNNDGIPRMVKGYFYEMACVISECARVLKPGAPIIMVNDNVRYAGASIPVDLILSDIASELGLLVEKILVLPNGKGNSSQQMGEHGRDRLRKCVYVWRKR
jgi:DNA modification methylase